jgi:hypothetical protein
VVIRRCRTPLFYGDSMSTNFVVQPRTDPKLQPQLHTALLISRYLVGYAQGYPYFIVHFSRDRWVESLACHIHATSCARVSRPQGQYPRDPSSAIDGVSFECSCYDATGLQARLQGPGREPRARRADGGGPPQPMPRTWKDSLGMTLTPRSVPIGAIG